ncbi:MAG: hypothetical protein Q4A60_04090 [Pasteurellaceae bacterium]|nr:hypothetical protein [Pasteurellaceae bacterium]
MESITVGLAILAFLGCIAYYYSAKAVEEKLRREKAEQDAQQASETK